MKNSSKYMMFVAAAAMAFTSCSKDATEDLPATGNGERTVRLTINADIRDTRVSLDDNHSKLCWIENDKIGLFTDAETTPYEANYTAATAADGFGVDVAQVPSKVYAYYPYVNGNTDKSKVTLSIAADQNQAEAGKLQGANDGGSGQFPMVATGTVDADNKVSLSFCPVASAFAVNIYGKHEPGETVKSVSFTPNGSINNVGSQQFDLTALTGSEVYNNPDHSRTATVTLGTAFEPADSKPADTKIYDKQVYICTARTNYSAGGTFVVTTCKTTYTFAITKPLDCSNTDFYRVNLNLERGEKPTMKFRPLEQPETDLLFGYAGGTKTYYVDANVDWNVSSENKYAVVEKIDAESFTVKLPFARAFADEQIVIVLKAAAENSPLEAQTMTVTQETAVTLESGQLAGNTLTANAGNARVKSKGEYKYGEFIWNFSEVNLESGYFSVNNWAGAVYLMIQFGNDKHQLSSGGEVTVNGNKVGFGFDGGWDNRWNDTKQFTAGTYPADVKDLRSLRLRIEPTTRTGTQQNNTLSRKVWINDVLVLDNSTNVGDVWQAGSTQAGFHYLFGIEAGTGTMTIDSFEYRPL